MCRKLFAVLVSSGLLWVGAAMAQAIEEGPGQLTNVSASTGCVAHTVNGGGNEFWDYVQGSVLALTISNTGLADAQISVIVHNSDTATSVSRATVRAVIADRAPARR